MIKQILPRVKSQREVLSQFLGHEAPKSFNRVKRGWFDFIGTGAKILFGTLDNDDAHYYNDQISKLSKDEKDLINLIKEQSHVVQTTIKNFNSTLINLNMNENILNNNTKKLEQYLNTVIRDTNFLQARQDIDEQFSLLTFIINQYQTENSKLIEAILFAKNGIIHPSIITPRQFVQELQELSQHLANDVEFPLPLTFDNAHLLLNLIDLNVAYVDSKLIYIIEIPLVQLSTLNLYHLTPLPTKQMDQKYLFIQPSGEYLAINDNKQQYLILHDISKEICKVLNKENYICKQTEPILLTHIGAICEVKLYLLPNKIPSNCDVRVINLQSNIWHQLLKSNTWIFILVKSETLTVNCKSLTEPQDVKVSGTGSITLDNDCKAFSSSAVLNARGTYTNNINIQYIPPLDVNLDDCLETNNKHFNLSEITLDHVYRSSTLRFDELNTASHKLSQLEKAADELLMSKNNVHSYSILYYLTYILSIIFVIYVACKIFIYFKNSRRRVCGCLPNLCITFNNQTNPRVEPSTNVSFEADNENIHIQTPQPRRSDRIKQRKNESF